MRERSTTAGKMSAKPSRIVHTYLEAMRKMFGPSCTINDLIVAAVLVEETIGARQESTFAARIVEVGRVPASTVSRCISTMVALGLIRESVNERDRRVRNISFTEKGLAAALEVRTAVFTAFEQSVESFRAGEFRPPGA